MGVRVDFYEGYERSNLTEVAGWALEMDGPVAYDEAFYGAIGDAVREYMCDRAREDFGRVPPMAVDVHYGSVTVTVDVPDADEGERVLEFSYDITDDEEGE